jgi:hypothetical protein
MKTIQIGDTEYELVLDENGNQVLRMITKQKVGKETLEDGEHNPVTFDTNEYYDLALHGIDYVSFAVANNPFFKLDNEKYFPEALVINA